MKGRVDAQSRRRTGGPLFASPAVGAEPCRGSCRCRRPGRARWTSARPSAKPLAALLSRLASSFWRAAARLAARLTTSGSSSVPAAAPRPMPGAAGPSAPARRSAGCRPCRCSAPPVGSAWRGRGALEEHAEDGRLDGCTNPGSQTSAGSRGPSAIQRQHGALSNRRPSNQRDLPSTPKPPPVDMAANSWPNWACEGRPGGCGCVCTRRVKMLPGQQVRHPRRTGRRAGG